MPVAAGRGQARQRIGEGDCPVTGVGLRWALPLVWTCRPPECGLAVTMALPLALMAEDELESTTTTPGTRAGVAGKVGAGGRGVEEVNGWAGDRVPCLSVSVPAT